MGRFIVYRTTQETGEEHWGERYHEDKAISYAEFIFEKYEPEGELEREDDPLVRVRVVEDVSKEEVFRKEAESEGSGGSGLPG